MNDIHSLTPCDYNNEKKDLSSLSIKRSRLDHHHHHQYQHHQSTELTSTSAKRAFITVEDNEEGEYNCTQDNILNTTTNYIDTGIKLTSNDEYQHHDLEKTSSSSSSSSPISTPTTIATHQTTSITVVNNSNSYINDENKDQLNIKLHIYPRTCNDKNVWWMYTLKEQTQN
uniref:Uncharacterized protein n=1 Tax=Schistosoma haematobium TaxID=6185 RepID=A0A094ZER9_SCHHA